MRGVLLTVALAFILLALPATAGADEPGSWAFAIGNGNLAGDATAVAQRLEAFDLVVVDGEEATRTEVAALQANGTTVLGYLSVGTIEKWRSWYKRLKPFRLDAWGDWEGEWFARTSSGDYRRKMVKIAKKRVLAKGFDGLFLDNVDMVEDPRYARQRKGMSRLVRDLDKLVGSNRELWAQNGFRGVVRGYRRQHVKPLWRHLDGWNREDVSHTWDFKKKRYRPVTGVERNLVELFEVAALGLRTTTTDYLRVNPLDTEAACIAYLFSTSAGALPYVADIGLSAAALTVNPPVCD